MSLLKENIMKKIEENKLLKEGLITKGKLAVFYEEFPAVMKALIKIDKIAKKYIVQCKKDFASGKYPDMENPMYMGLEILFETQPMLGTHIFKKNKKDKTWIKIKVFDGNGIAPHLLKDWIAGEVKVETTFKYPPQYVK
jgi:hypothetical protein